MVATSGTTGGPRLARLPLDRITASVEAWRGVLPPASGWLLSLGLSHVAGIGIVARAATEGVPVVIPVGTHPDEMLQAIRFARLDGVVVSHLSLVAAQLARLLDATDDAPPPEGIAAVLLGGGPIPESLVVRAVAAGWPVVPSYGMTETASGVVAMPLGGAGERPWSAGRALPGVELRIGPGAVARRTVSGELWVRGPMLFAGYLDDAEATAARFDADGWFRTGDLCQLDADGWLRFIDRVDDVIVSGGEKVAPAEVEAALLACPGVAEAGVVGIPDERWGRVPAAVIVPRRGWDPSDEALRDELRERLAPWKVPARFLRAASLPRGGGEKLLRRVLAEWVVAAPLHRHSTRLPPMAPPSPVPSRPASSLPTTARRSACASSRAPRKPCATPKVAAVLVLHATLSSSAQLVGLGAQLSDLGGVLLLDRRGSGGSVMARPAAVSVARHVADALATLDACGVERAILVGHSFGAVVALELAARHPDRVMAVAAWEPPLIPLAAEPDRSRLLAVADLRGRRPRHRWVGGRCRGLHRGRLRTGSLAAPASGATRRHRGGRRRRAGRCGDARPRHRRPLGHPLPGVAGHRRAERPVLRDHRRVARRSACRPPGSPTSTGCVTPARSPVPTPSRHWCSTSPDRPSAPRRPCTVARGLEAAAPGPRRCGSRGRGGRTSSQLVVGAMLTSFTGVTSSVVGPSTERGCRPANRRIGVPSVRFLVSIAGINR